MLKISGCPSRSASARVSVLVFDNTVILSEAGQTGRSVSDLTEVLYVYRNVNLPEQIEYKELLLSDFRARIGDVPLRKCLEPDILSQVFGR